MNAVVVAIDGPSASGKGTIAKLVAEKLGFDYLNTGSIYRAVAYFGIEKKTDFACINYIKELIDSLDFSNLDGLDLYNSVVSEKASIIAAIPEVRRALFNVQRNFAKGKQGAVIEGRDIGTVIFPDAALKIYITADINERVIRRFKQLQKSEKSITYSDVLRDLQTRDLRDSSRNSAPLVKGNDYHIIDTTKMSVEEAVHKVMELVSLVSVYR
jgi:cytidylate kinase